MARALPSAVARFLLISIGSISCHHEVPVTPADPLPAEGEIAVGPMKAECDALVAALERWRTCPNVEKEDLDYIEWWQREAETDFTAGAKVTIEPAAQQAIALRCRKATTSVDAAIARCGNGHRPKS